MNLITRHYELHFEWGAGLFNLAHPSQQIFFRNPLYYIEAL